MKINTTSQEFFEEKYRRHPDPWDFASSKYELERYRTIKEAVSDRRYRRAFEPGCSIGVLTAQLASICDRVEAMDISPTAVRHARKRCRNWANVEIRCGTLPECLPNGSFDLIVLSEIGYYFDECQLKSTAIEVVARLRKPGVLLAVHWLGLSGDHLLSGERVHEILGTIEGLSHTDGKDHDAFRLDRWEPV
jgi:SAM-dependent methyltransferase